MARHEFQPGPSHLMCDCAVCGASELNPIHPPKARLPERQPSLDFPGAGREALKGHQDA